MSLLSDDEKVQHLQQRWAEGALDLQAFERLLVEVIESGAWRSFHTPNGAPVQPPSFRHFVTEQPFRGLGTTPEKIANHLGDNNAAVVKMKDLLKGKSGAPVGNTNAVKDRKAEEKQSTNNISRLTKHGTRRDYTLERLERERPDLRARVDANELTANAAAIEAGFRSKTFTVPADRPESIVATLRRQLKPDVLAAVTTLLTTTAV